MKFEVKVIRVEETEWETYRNVCWPLFYTEAVSEAQAINNVRYRVRSEMGWRDHDENNGSVSVRYEFEARCVDEHGFEQLKLF